ncbi:transport protein [Salinibacterium xinjiangense]|uniref:Glycerol uptake facilitator (Major Intrinsic Protein Family) n=1 Tax=Salinibacterium xinjiangense TaxID=386302 RepID=A0A2C8ZJS8_9MICO|nr:MIP/aquaporin family protein [Salinibacterium xinjiangense]GGK88402.1 transport protein [Salinibacterium xinjiangense]SOE65143.1 Glycerol uptake facilitator (Major Intrinsic Protein Family) [Salinibacterium xinjiangense]
MKTALLRRVTAELVGSAALAAIVVGSGIAAQRLSPTDAGLQLLENAVATALGLSVLIMLFAPLSGAHFNPVVSLVESGSGLRSWRDTAFYIPAQVIGCILGAILANVLFGDAAVSVSSTERLTPPHFLSEIVATAGLIMVIFVLARTGRSGLTAAAVGAYIGTAYFFTSSTSFANPAITIGRMFSDTFAGIAPSSAPGFVAAQLIGGALGFALVRWFYPDRRIIPNAK